MGKLSNTAVPKYYGQFRERVLNGEIPVCQELSMEMNRIDALIANPGVYYDIDAVEGWVEFCEEELTLANGDNLHLLDSFKLWGEQVFGWFYFVERTQYVPDPGGHGGHYERNMVKRRLINKQFLIVGRGAAKSMYASCMQAYFLIVDRSTTQQMTSAPTVAQTEEVLSPIKTAIARARGPLFKFLTEGSLNATNNSKANRVKLTSTKKGIENFLTNSVLQAVPMSIDNVQGRKDRVATIDEWLSGDIRENIIGAVEQGASKQDDYFILAISSEGTVRNSSGDEIKMEVMSILNGEYPNPHVSIFYYKLDDIMEVGDPSKWLKANPNIGQPGMVSYEAYQRDVEKMEHVPSSRNDILAKRFGIPSEGYTYFFTYDETLVHRPQAFWDMSCSMGVDLSMGDDFCAFDFLFPLGRDRFGLKTLCYISARTMTKLPPPLRQKYDDFLNEGSLCVLEGATLDMMEVFDDVERYIYENRYDVRSVGYDPYNATEFMTRWKTENGAYGVDIIRQGSKTESVPLGELKMLTEDRFLFFDQQITSWCMQNAITLVDTNGNRKLHKKRADQKIDVVAALIDAYVSYKMNRDMFE